jgi:hypothetical protein
MSMLAELVWNPPRPFKANAARRRACRQAGLSATLHCTARSTVTAANRATAAGRTMPS